MMPGFREWSEPRPRNRVTNESIGSRAMSVVPIDAGEGQAQVHVKYERLIAAAKQVPSAVTIVVHPCDESSLRGVSEAAAAGIINPVLVGPAPKIKGVAPQSNFDSPPFQTVDTPHAAPTR